MLAATSASADCVAPATRLEMTECALTDYTTADADLNAAYKKAMATMKALDAGQEGGGHQVEALRDAQRAWIPFRDAACLAESGLYLGGSLEPMGRYECFTRLTRTRIEDLARLYEAN